MLDSHLTSHGSALSTFPTKLLLFAPNGGMSAISDLKRCGVFDCELRVMAAVCGSTTQVCLLLRLCVDGEEIGRERAITCDIQPQDQATCGRVDSGFFFPHCRLNYSLQILFTIMSLFCIIPFPLKGHVTCHRFWFCFHSTPQQVPEPKFQLGSLEGKKYKKAVNNVKMFRQLMLIIFETDLPCAYVQVTKTLLWLEQRRMERDEVDAWVNKTMDINIGNRCMFPTTVVFFGNLITIVL